VSGATQAAFVSYSSQDAEAASHICEALRSAGFDVWFDKSELRGGDAWDQNIRQQIRDCTLFLPIISASTQARAEGYFRLEWRLADQRTHLMGRSRAFLVPICVDTTPEKDADVPDSFSAVQWTRLPEGMPTAEFVARVGRLLKQPAAGAAADRSPQAGRVPAEPLSPRHWRIGVTIAVVVAAMAVAYYLSVSSHRELAPLSRPRAVEPVQSVSRAIPDKSIAVLPFTDMSEKHDQEYFADGMAEEIINLLAQVPNLRVPGRTSSFYFKGKSIKIPDIARELGVANVLEGSVRQSGNRLRVTAQLIRADSGYHLWSETFDRNLHDVFETQDDIANAVVQALQITLMGGPLTRQKGGTKNLDAYQLFLRALSDFSLNSKSALGSAHEHLDQAIKLDPDFALAPADLGWVIVLQSQHSVFPQKEAAERARLLAQRALQLSPELAEAHALLQYIHRTYDWDWASCEAEGREALRIDPSNVHALVTAGKLARTLGRWDDAQRYANAALARDPFYTYAIWDLGRASYGAGRFADAEASYRKLLALAPDFGGARSHLVTTLVQEGRPDAALAMARQDSDEEDRLTVLPIALQASNRKGEADEALHTLIAKFGNGQAYSVARIYAFRGESDLAFEWLDRAYQQRDTSLLEFVGEHLFANVANDVRYKAFLRKMNLPE